MPSENLAFFVCFNPYRFQKPVRIGFFNYPKKG